MNCPLSALLPRSSQQETVLHFPTASRIVDNFVSNSWRVHSEANSHDALLRTSEGFGGLLAGNALEEFWPDVKKHVFHIHH